LNRLMLEFLLRNAGQPSKVAHGKGVGP
jgi:hypothetical protein